MGGDKQTSVVDVCELYRDMMKMPTTTTTVKKPEREVIQKLEQTEIPQSVATYTLRHKGTMRRQRVYKGKDIFFLRCLKEMLEGMWGKFYRCPSRIPRISDTEVRSARKGIKSVSSASCGSLNQEETGTALLGWKIYEAGELSRIMVSAIGLPSWDRSCRSLLETISRQTRY
jgi:hypothetical protein